MICTLLGQETPSQNPASIRLFDRTTRLGLEGSNRVSYSGTRPQNRL